MKRRPFPLKALNTRTQRAAVGLIPTSNFILPLLSHPASLLSPHAPYTPPNLLIGPFIIVIESLKALGYTTRGP